VALFGGGREMQLGFWGRDLKEGDHLECLRVGGRIILKWFPEK